MKYEYVAIFLFSVFISSISQIILKKSALKTYESKIKEYLNPYVITAYSIFLISSFITMMAYKGVPLSAGPILEATGYIWVTLLGALILKEKVSPVKLCGLAVIIAGIVVFNLNFCFLIVMPDL